MLTPSPWGQMLLGAALFDNGDYDLYWACPRCGESLGFWPSQRCKNCGAHLRMLFEVPHDLDDGILFYVENPNDKD